jgi:hypothetical protein
MEHSNSHVPVDSFTPDQYVDANNDSSTLDVSITTWKQQNQMELTVSSRWNDDTK